MQLPDTPQIETQQEVMFFDTDAGGVVHNVAYLRLIEIARTHLGAALGFPLKKMSETGQFMVVVRTEIDYLRPAVLGDLLSITCRLDSMEKVRFWCESEIIRPADGVVIARCRQALARVTLPSGKPTRIPKEWLERYPKLIEKRKKAE